MKKHGNISILKEIGKAKRGYVLHHKDWTLRHENVERYLEWRIEDLEMMTKSEHMRLHQMGENNCIHKLTEEQMKARGVKIAAKWRAWEAANPEQVKQLMTEIR